MWAVFRSPIPPDTWYNKRVKLFLKRSARYVSIGVGTFCIDLALLFFFIDVLALNVLVSAGLAFLGALSLNYLLARKYVFLHSNRGIVEGYVYYIIIALSGMSVTVFLMWVLTTHTDLHFAVSRSLIAFFVGIANYFANLIFNFKVAGVEMHGEYVSEQP